MNKPLLPTTGPILSTVMKILLGPDDTGCPIVEGRGRFMQTRYAGKFHPFDPRPEEVDIRDIAAALAKKCRYGGHCSRFYSVAQHSVLVSEIVPEEMALWGLLHDAAEAYVGDMIRPIKLEMPEFRRLEAGVMDAIVERFSLRPVIEPAAVKYADNIALSTEARDLFDDISLDWGALPDPLPERIDCLYPMRAEQHFLGRFCEITGGIPL